MFKANFQYNSSKTGGGVRDTNIVVFCTQVDTWTHGMTDRLIPVYLQNHLFCRVKQTIVSYKAPQPWRNAKESDNKHLPIDKKNIYKLSPPPPPHNFENDSNKKMSFLRNATIMQKISVFPSLPLSPPPPNS